MNQTTIWTALPNGTNGTKLRLSAHLSVRLAGTPITKLSAFPDFLNWPVPNLSFKLHFSGMAPIAVTPYSAVVPGLWNQFFPADGPVKPFDYQPQAGKEIHTFAAGAVHAYLLGMHGANTLAGSLPYFKPEDLYGNPNIANADIYRPPSAASATTLKAEQGRNYDESKAAQALDQKYAADANRLRKDGAVPTDPKLILWEAKRFFQPYKVPYPFEPPVPDVDFHSALAMLGQHGQLMRAMGIVFDFEFDAPVAPTGTVQLEVHGNFTTAPINVFPLTHYEHDAANKVFRAQAQQGGEIRESFFDMSPGKVDIVEIDINGGVQKAMDFAREVRRMITMKASDSPEGQPIPSARSAGVSAVRNNRVAAVQKMLKASDDHNSKLTGGQTVELYAEDVLKGWRPDIWDQKTWFSLCRRDTKYRLGKSGKFAASDDEGQVSMAMSTDPTAPSDPAKLHESMWTWNGWSLVVPRPGNTLDKNDHLDTSWPKSESDFNAQFDSGKNQDKFYKLGVFSTAHPNSLPSLRFSHAYFMRARAADLAGNSVSVGTDSAFTPKPSFKARDFTYFRFDPLISPTLYEATARKEGDSANIVVIRLYVSTPTVDATIRHILPPASDESMAERHGMMDDSTKGVVDPAKWAMVKKVETRPALAVPVAAQVTEPPYLPDPVTLGATLAFVDPSNKNKPWVLGVKYDGAWPDLHSGKLTLEAASTPTAAASQAGSEFKVDLLPGQVVTARLSSNLPEKALPNFAQWAAIELWASKDPKINLNVIKALVAGGLNHTITPYRDIKLVFATQIPFEKPAMKEMSAQRPDGATFAVLTGDLAVHNWSTVEVDLQAHFEDMVDHLEEERRTTLSIIRDELAVKVKIPRHDENSHYPIRFLEREEFHDTKAHFIKYTMTAISRFRDYFPQDWLSSNDPNKRFTESAPVTKEIVVRSSKRPDSVPLEYVIPTFEWSDGPAASPVVHAKRGNSLRIYMRRPWFSSGNEEKLAVVLMGQGPARPALAVLTGENPFLEKYATRFGTDPAFGNAMITQDPTPANFPTSDPPSGSLNVPEYPGVNLVAVPFTPGFDEDRQMWYADIDIDTGTDAYTPFVRLALARYQAYSNQGMELSKLVTADIVQLAPDRTAVLSVLEPGKRIKVSLFGIAGASLVGKNRAFGTLEQRVGSDEDAGWAPVMLGGNEVIEEIPISPPVRRPPVVKPVQVAISPSAARLKAPSRAKSVAHPIEVEKLSPAEYSAVTAIAAQAGVFDLPGPGSYRVVIREYEQHHSMSGWPQPGTGIVLGVESKTATVPASRMVAGRLVHVDTLQVP